MTLIKYYENYLKMECQNTNLLEKGVVEKQICWKNVAQNLEYIKEEN